MITGLALKGGGVWGPAEAGAYDEGCQMGLFSGLQRVIGTSAGSLLASMVALKYSSQQILSAISSLNFHSFKDGWDPLREFTKLGLYTGNHLQVWAETLVFGATKKHFATFGDLKQMGFLDLNIVATALNLQKYFVFNWDNTPEVIVSEACRASASIPFFFERFVPSVGPKYIFEDGGIVKNYPLELLPQSSENIGLFLYNQPPAIPLSIDPNDAEAIALNTFEAMMYAQDFDVLDDADLKARTVIIPVTGSSTNFNVTAAEIASYVAAGRTAIRNYKIAA